MKRALIIITLLLSSTAFLVQSSFAQGKTGKISGLVTDDKQKGIDGATVSLLRTKDAGLVKVSVTDKAGYFDFEKIPDGDYTVSVTVTGFQ